MNRLLRAIVFVVSVSSLSSFAQDGQRDFYAEPGLNPFKSSAGQDSTENIDPFSGNVQLSYRDLTVPGNGGLDISITRVYNLPQSLPAPGNPFGYGWTMHFGRITMGSNHVLTLCSAADVPDEDTSNNPVLEFPDGGRSVLVRSAALDDGTYITKTNWKADCIDPSDHTKGLVATAPNGTKYYLRDYTYMQGEDGAQGEPAPASVSWLVDFIEDVYGNTLTITYTEIASGMRVPTQIDASDGRQVVLGYLDATDNPITATSNNARLSAIESNGQTWQYEYSQLVDVAPQWGQVRQYSLDQVIRPDGSHWSYEYGTTPNTPEFQRLTTVSYPYGGEVHYAYQWVQPYSPNLELKISAIDTKTQTNPGHPTGLWSYQFSPGSKSFDDLNVGPFPENSGRMADFTQITSPAGVEHIYHTGYWAMLDRTDVLYQMGLKLVHRYYEVNPSDQSLTLVRAEGSSWGSRVISTEAYRGGVLPAVFDNQTYAPELSQAVVSMGGVTYLTTFENYDAFGNAGTITESRAYTNANEERVTQATYLNDTANWFIGLPDATTVHEGANVISTTSRQYNVLGRIEQENSNGVITQYTYTAGGDVEDVTDALGHTTTYSNYFRGIPQLEELPDGTQQSRVVNGSGTVASQTTGRGNITSFVYDDLNRLTNIDYPIGTDVSVSWGSVSKVLTRGAYQETVTWDGFGREVEVNRQDTVNGSSYTKTYSYDALGRRDFESDANSASGISWDYDSLGRITRVTNQDATFKTINYVGAHQEFHTNENGDTTEYLYQVFGSPENRSLYVTYSPEGLATFINRDANGLVKSVLQAGIGHNPDLPDDYSGYALSYGYNSRNQLISIDSPHDIGLTTYGRDLLGNMTSRQVASSNLTAYTYDELSRPKSIDYVDDTIDVDYTYDADGNLKTIGNSFGTRTNDYDANGNLFQETIAIGLNTYQIGYSINGLDVLESITYPSGRTLNYAPDALGRPTQAMPYLTNVSFFPDGNLQQMDYANGQSTAYTRTTRNWIDTIATGSVQLQDYAYDDTGNIKSITDGIDSARNRSMNYDGLNRLTNVQGSWEVANYTYDQLSNVLTKSDPANSNRTLTYQYSDMRLESISNSNNTLKRSFSYDNYGNVDFSDDALYDPVSGFPLQVFTRRQQQFNDAGNMIYSLRQGEDDLENIVPLKSGSFSSEYDANNMRIKKINHSQDNAVSEYVYSQAGKLLGEYDESGVDYGHEYFYLGSQQIASAKENTPPSVSAGGPVSVFSGQSIDIVGSDGDLDGTVVSRGWSQVSGPSVTLQNTDNAIVSISAPTVTESQVVVLQYSVTDDRGAISTSQVSVTVEFATDYPPIADAGPDVFGVAGSSVALDASASTDSEGAITYSWVGEGIDNPSAVNPNVQVVDSGTNVTKTYQLTVTDSMNQQSADSVDITFYSMGQDTDGDGLPDAWEFDLTGDIGGADPHADLDGDGATNLEEMARGSDPQVPDIADLYKVLSGSEGNTILWTVNPQAQFYRVFSTTDDTSDPGTWPMIAETSDRHVLHSSLLNGQNYYYRVEAHSASSLVSESSILQASPAALDFKVAELTPLLIDPQTGWNPDRTRTVVDSNRFGDIVVVTERRVGTTSVRELIEWQYSVFGGWSAPVVVYSDTTSTKYFSAAIDNDRNVLVTYVSDDNPSSSAYKMGYSRYRPFQANFQTPELIDASITPQISMFSWMRGLDFDDKGNAHVCYERKKYRSIPNQSSYYSMPHYGKFIPGQGWSLTKDFYPQHDSSFGRYLSCDVSGDGRVAASWQHQEFYESGGYYSPTYDTFLAVSDESGNWSQRITMEEVLYGQRDTLASDTVTAPAAVVMTDMGEAVVTVTTPGGEETTVYNVNSDQWSQIPSLGWTEDAPKLLSVSDTGLMLLAWGTQYTTRNIGDVAWEQAGTLAAPLTLPSLSSSRLAGLDADGSVYNTSATITDSHINIHVNDGGPPSVASWNFDQVEDKVIAGDKNVLWVGPRLDSAYSILWISDAGEIFHSQQAAAGVVAVISSISDVAPNELVALDGSASYATDDTIVNYHWEQLFGGSYSSTGVAINNVNGAIATFTAPAGEHTLGFRLTITTSGGATADSLISVTVTEPVSNSTPTVDVITPSDGTTITQGDSLTLSGSSNDTEDGDLTYSIQWSSSLDGSLGSGTGVLISNLSVGNHTITASVTDSGSLTASDSVSVLVNQPVNTPPTISLISPIDDAIFTEDDVIIWTASSTDVEDGDLTSSIVWDSDIDGILGTGTDITIPYISSGDHYITVSVTDSGGLVASDSVSISVTEVFGSEPSIDLLAPEDGTTITEGESLTLVASGTENAEGDITDSIEWSSSLDGALGTGSGVVVSNLSVGTHMVTALVYGSADDPAVETVTVTVLSNGGGPDGDGDGVADAADNCPALANPNQTDVDGDSIGNVCDIEQMTLLSIASEDGWVRESGENSDVGSTTNFSNQGNKALRIGDHKKDKQYKSIVSFDLSAIPLTASLDDAVLELTRANGSIVGDVSGFGDASLNLKIGSLSDDSALQGSDFQAAVTEVNAGTLIDGLTAVGTFTTAGIQSLGQAVGAAPQKVQIRLEYSVDDNDDRGNDYTGYYSSNNSNTVRHPRLIIDYSLPD